MDSDDARYERPCRWLLAVAAGIHWVAALLVIRNHLAGISDAVALRVDVAEIVRRAIELT